MSFLSPAFMFIFLPVVMGILSLTPRARRTNALSVIGIVFFVCINISDPLALIYISFVVATVTAAMAIYKKTHKTFWLELCASVFFALGATILIFRLFHVSPLLRGAGVVICLMSSVSVCLDVARGETKAPSRLWEGLTYVTYFPTMLTGPFITYEEFTERTRGGLSFNAKSFSKGSFLFLKGFVKSVYIGTILADVFKGLLSFGHSSMGIAPSILIAAAQSLALYAFFSGYSDIARGISMMVGIELESDMGDPFLNLSPSEYLRRFFKGFSVFFKRYIAAPIISHMGENLISRAIASLLSATMLLLLFCQNFDIFLLLLPFASVAEYFVLFGRSSKKILHRPRIVIQYIITFIIMGSAWAVVSSASISEMLTFLENIFSNGVFYLSHAAADRLLNPRYIVLPLLGCIVSSVASFVIARDEKAGDRLWFTILKYIVSAVLLLAFALGIIMLLPQFPNLASDIFGVNFI